MLEVIVKEQEFFNEESQEFETRGGFVLELEHSLVSLSKWESMFQKPFLGPEAKSPNEIMYYIYFMVLSPKISPEVISHLSQENVNQIQDYIESNQSATTFGLMPQGHGGRGRAEIITSELIYYWMIAFNIPFECQHWHLNRLFSLIRICNIKNSKQKKMSRHELAARNRELNAKRRAELNTTG